MRRIRSAVVVSVVLVVAMTLVSGTTATAAPPRAKQGPVEGPVTGGKGIFFVGSTLFDLGTVGYEQSEYFLSGSAASYASSKRLTSDGRWQVHEASRAAYKTRMVVYRPIDPRRFNGRVYVEWLNISGGIDAAAAWLSGHNELIREGAAYIGVTAQAGGINGVPDSTAGSLGDGLKKIDPARYGSLKHPGDSYSYDIFTQAGEAVRDHGRFLLDGLTAKTVLAVGESQSAARLTTYLDALGPRTHLWDGYLVYSRGATGAPLSQDPLPDVATPAPTYIRTDLHQPVLIFTTEADLMILGYLTARQPDTRLIREWEIPGSAHDDIYGIGISRTDPGDASGDIDAFQSMLTPTASPVPGILECSVPINAGSHTYELRAALNEIGRWARHPDQPHRAAPRLQTRRVNGVTTFKFDHNGNVLGGIRRPQVDAPVAELSGLGQPTSGGRFCSIFGTTVPFSSNRLNGLYPTHQAFVRAWNKAVDGELGQHFLLPADAARLKLAAAQSTVPN